MVNNAKHFGIVWKELHKFNAGGSRNILTPPNKPTKRSRSDEKIEPGKVEKTKLPIFLGVELNLELAELRWKHAPKRDAKLKALSLIPRTRRQIAEIVGSVIWDCIVHLQRLGQYADIFSFLSVVAKEVSHKKDWDHSPTVKIPEVCGMPLLLKTTGSKIFRKGTPRKRLSLAATRQTTLPQVWNWTSSI